MDPSGRKGRGSYGVFRYGLLLLVHTAWEGNWIIRGWVVGGWMYKRDPRLELSSIGLVVVVVVFFFTKVMKSDRAAMEYIQTPPPPTK